MEIAFVRPAAPYNRYIQNVPLNYIHLSAWLREHGHTPMILDMVVEESTDRVDRYIRHHHVQVAGIGCMTCELPDAIEEARRLKDVHPGIKVVLGGAHPSADPEECLKSGVVDYVIVGEGEIPLTALLDALEKGEEPKDILGLWSIKDGQVVGSTSAAIPNVEDLPMPAYDLLDLEKYFRLDSPWHFPKSRKAVQYDSSRGCPYHCSYCHTIHGKKYRGMSAAKVVNEIEELVTKHGIEELMVVDDIFNFDLDRAKDICRGIVDRGIKVHLQFPNGVRGDRFDEELVALMKKAGTHYMAIAIETTSERYQMLIRKHLKHDKALQTIHWARKYGIEVCGFFMIGFPGESLKEIHDTLEFAVSAPLDTIFISLVSPFKGTVLRTDMLNGRFGEIDQSGIAALDQLFPTVHNEEVSVETLRKLQRSAYWRFYLKPRPMMNLGRRMTNWSNVKKVSRAIRRRVTESKISSLN
jgi:anaerobic magnesium-protoporphyrin IX monomethyl ester cyclase